MTVNKIKKPLPAATKLVNVPQYNTYDLLGDRNDLKQWSDLNANRKTWALIPYGISGHADPIRSKKLLEKRPKLISFFEDFPGEVKHAVYSYLSPENVIGLHRDTYNEHGVKRPKFEIFNTALRFHIPLITNNQAFYYSENFFYQMELGDLWMINNHFIHGVINNSKTEGRYHLIFDVIPNAKTKKLFTGSDSSLGFKNDSLFQRFNEYNEREPVE